MPETLRPTGAIVKGDKSAHGQLGLLREPTRTAHFSEGVFQPPQPISPLVRTDLIAGPFMRWLVISLDLLRWRRLRSFARWGRRLPGQIRVLICQLLFTQPPIDLF